MNRSKIRRITIVMLLTLTMALLVPTAQAVNHGAPLYDELERVIIIDGTVVDGVMTAAIDGQSGDTFLINTGLTLADGSARLSQVKLTLSNDASGTIRITEIDPPDNAPPDAIAFFRVELEGFSDADIGEVELLFVVDNKFVNVRLYRLSNGTWAALDTSRVETGQDSSTYSASSPGFSDFAIVAQEGEVQTTKPDELPFTSGAYLYFVGLLGLVFLVTGATIRIRAGKE